MLRLGGNVDSWCGKCGLILAHTIEAMVDGKPARVQCNTCKTQHRYKLQKPGEGIREVRERKAGGSIGVQPRQPRASRYQVLLKGKDIALAKSYSPKDNYVLGEVVRHPTFGVGVTTDLKDGTKIEVLFEEGPKVLVHAR